MFLRLSIHNIGKRKFRSFLIILSVALSVALLYTILSLSQTITHFYEEQLSMRTGETNILVSASDDAKSPLLTKTQTAFLQENPDIAFAVPVLEGFGYYTPDTVAIPIRFHGVHLNDMPTVYPKSFTQAFVDAHLETFSTHQLIIGEFTAKELNLSAGDNFTITIAGQVITYTIAIIHQDNNLLSSNSTLHNVLVPMEALENILNVEDQASIYYVGTRDDNESTLIDNWSLAYPHIKSQLATGNNALQQMLEMIKVSLSLMTMSVLLVSAFIIYSTFKVIILERMSFIGTIRSLGATKKVSRKVLFMEGLFYGVFGGIFGVLLGFLILKLTINQVFMLMQVDIAAIQLFYVDYALISFLLALVLVALSCVVPIVQISKYSIKSLLFTEFKNSKHFSIPHTIIGSTMMICAFLLVQTPIKDLKMPFSFLSILFITVGGALLVPTLAMVFSKLVKGLMKLVLGQHGSAATTQIAHDKTLMNNIILMSMGLAVILMINNFSANVSDLVTKAYATGRADIMMNYQPFTDDFLEIVENTEGVTHLYTTKHTRAVSANDGEIHLPFIEGIDGKGYADYAWDEFGYIFTDEFISTFQSERSMIISKLTANNNQLNLGDTITLTLNEKPVNYKIIAIVSSLMNNGNMSYIYEDFFTEDTGIQYHTSLYIKANSDPKAVIQRIKENSPLYMYPLISLTEMEEMNANSNESLFRLMKAISLIAMFIGSIGIFNNYIISFISRRKFMATLRSLGVSQSSMLKLLLSEAILSGIIGSLCGIGIGITLLEAMKYVLENINMSSDLIGYSLREIAFVALSGILLGIVGALLPALSHIKRPIVPELKYE